MYLESQEASKNRPLYPEVAQNSLNAPMSTGLGSDGLYELAAQSVSMNRESSISPEKIAIHVTYFLESQWLTIMGYFKPIMVYFGV